MPEYLAPGVYVEEISTGPKPIEGVSTSNAAMLGVTERGPEPPRLITSFLEYQRTYGGYVPDRSYLAYAVRGFFDNGGKRCFVGRIVGDNAVATQGEFSGLNVFAIGRGEWGNNIMIKIEAGSKSTPIKPSHKITLLYYRVMPDPFVDPTSTEPDDLTNPNRRNPDVLEVHDNVTVDPNSSSNVIKILNSASKLVRVSWGDDDPQALADVALVALGDTGTDGDAITATTFNGSTNLISNAPGQEVLGRGRGLAAIATIDEVSIVLVPDEVRNGLGDVTAEVIKQCELLKDRFAVVSAEQGRNQNLTNLLPPQDTSYAAFYWPWIEVLDPTTNDVILIPPSGHVAGIYARTDIERGVHKAPANEVVRGARNLEFSVSKGMQDILNPNGVNAIRDFRPDGRGLRLWGARTMSSDGEWKYVNVRRLFLFIEESIDEGTQWVVFEPNHEPTWARVQRSITNFLIRVWRNGALQGVSQEEAFFVKCDRTTMTQDDIDNGRLICYIGVAPVKPAEFVIFRISQKTLEATG